MKKILLIGLIALTSTFTFSQRLNESFEGTTVPAPDWTIMYGNSPHNSSNDMIHYGFQSYSGSKSFRFSSYFSESGSASDRYYQYLISPLLSVTTTDSLVFWYKKSNFSTEHFRVGTSTTDSNITSFTWGADVTSASNSIWKKYVYSVPVGTKYVAINYTSTYLYYLYIDSLQGPNIWVPSCPKPTMLNAANITATTADISWMHATPSLVYGFEYGTAGFTLGTGTQDTAMTAMKSLTGLTPNTTYEFYVKALCTLTDSSVMAGPFSFTTPCLTASMPYSQDFTTWPPACWDLTGGANNWTHYTSGGAAEAGFWGISSGDLHMMTEPINISSHARLKFDWSHKYSFYYPNDSLNVEIRIGSGAWTSLWSAKGATLNSNDGAGNTSPGSYKNEVIFLDTNTYTGQNVQIRFNAVSGFGPDLFIDNVIVEAVPNCPEPTALGSTNETSTSADVYWTEAGGSSSWTYIYDTAGFNPDSSGTIVSASNDTMNISGLMNITSYDFYVRAHCSGLDSSILAGPFTFTTLCGTYTPDYSQDFTTYLPTCWEEVQGRLSTATSFSSTSSAWNHDGYSNIGTTGAVTLNIYGTSRDEWLISPTIDLGSGTTPYQVEFDASLTNWLYHTPDFMGTDDTLAFIISTDSGDTWTSANILHNFVSGNEPTLAGSRYFIDLSSYTGKVKFAFYGASTVSNQDYDVHIDNFFVTNLCVPTAVSMNDTACGTYTSPSGKIWATAGTYMDTIPMVRGCDSVLTITLVVNNSMDSVTETVCDSYTSPSGMVWTTTGMYMDTIPNAMGCDSIIAIDLTVNMSGSSATTVHACDNYTLPTGMVVTTTGVYVDTITTTLGCDSVVTTTLTVGYTSYSTLSATVCGSYTSPSGAVHVTSGTFFDTIPNTSGCDSVITITIIVKATTMQTVTVSSCDDYTLPSGRVVTMSGTYTDTTTNTFGCDHITTTILTINTAPASTISIVGTDLVCSNTGVAYKWVDCDNDFSYILGETNQNFAPTRNGNYACWITTTNGCNDTSACIAFNSVSLEEYVINENEISIFPNPATDFVTIDILSQNEDVTINMFDALGKLVYTKEVTSKDNKVTVDVSKFDRGVYTVSVYNEFFETSKKVTVVK